MSKYIEYNGFIVKISNKILSKFETYNLEEQTYATNMICKYLYDFKMGHKKNKINIINNNIEYFTPIIEFNKYDKSFRETIINKVILDIQNRQLKPVNNMFNKGQTVFSKVCEIIED